MSEGTIIFYSEAKKHGYLSMAGTKEEFFFRKKNLLTTEIKAGDRVKFILKESKQGYYADKIEIK